MKKISQAALLILFILVGGCKTKKKVTSTALSDVALEQYWEKQMGFDYLEARGKATIEENGRKQNVALHLKMKKDSIIWGKFSLFGFGVTVLVNQDSFYMIDNIQQRYMAEDKRVLDQYLGFKATVLQVQNLLLGNAIFSKELYKTNGSNEVLEANEGIATNTIQINEAFRTLFSKIVTPDTTQNAEIQYDMYEEQTGSLMPKIVNIKAKKGAVSLGAVLNYQNVNTTKQLTFPFKIPNGYKRM